MISCQSFYMINYFLTSLCSKSVVVELKQQYVLVTIMPPDLPCSIFNSVQHPGLFCGIIRQFVQAAFITSLIDGKATPATTPAPRQRC